MHAPNSEAAIDLAEFRSGWRVLILSLIGIAISINASLLYGFGTLVIPLQEAFGWERGAMQAAITFLFGGAVISLQLVGWFNLRFGMKRVTIISLVAIAFGYLATTQIGGSVWTLYLAFALLPLLGMGCLAVTWTQLLNMWFDKNRGLALAIGLSGTGLTAAVVPPLMSWGIGLWDWRAAFVILALLNLAVLLPITLFWFSLPQGLKVSAEEKAGRLDTNQLPGLTFAEGLASRKFWICNLALSLVISAIVGLVTSTVPMLRDKGISAENAGLIFGCFGVSLTAGRILIGYLLDRVWPPLVSAISLSMPAVGCLLFLGESNDFWLMAFAAVLVGFGAGAEFDIAAFLVARYFGMKEYGRLFGVHQGLNTVAAALAPLLFAAFLSATGSYSSMLIYSVACTVLGPLLILTLGRAPNFRTTGAFSR
ncbi:MAG: MFS transporter [Pseudomonadales bacterium]|uniref:MFS transporter n=1 Tax=Halopseudomonas aestusnigri TaxID=857252 RepID=UPI000C40189C|nr:MFS transporter [Halopseudomonas aestusnigri]MBP77539.1 MFS transporter [Pseudomonadales bacterium]MCC4262471.1 MFS transporter [Halopseudomonas aestusnigri]